MIVNITRSALNRLPVSPPSSTKQVMWDMQIPGFGAYKVSSGRISFVYQYRMPGSQTRSILIGYLGELSVEQAREMAGDYAQQRRKGIDPIAALQAAETEERAKTELVLSTYVEGYLQRRIDAKKPHNKAQTNIIRKDIVGLLGDKRIDKMTVEDVEKFAAILGERGESARRMGIVYLKAILNEACKREVISSSPAHAVETPKSGERDRRLRDHEIQRFYEAAHDVGGPRGDIYEVILRMLKRKEEVSRMTWEQLDLAKGRWYLPDYVSKNGKPYDIILPAQVISIIERQQPDTALRRGPVFTLDGGKTAPEMGSQVKNLLDANMHRRLEAANARDKNANSVAHFTIHDIRTTGASRMQEAPLKIIVDDINAVLLHVVGSGVTKIYLRSERVEEAGAALEKWNAWLDELVSSPSSWPGGRDLPPMSNAEMKERLALFREGWPERADQKRAREKREEYGEMKRVRKRTKR